ncbi:MAG: gliding motility-associated C-terminal domain-containing protein, partial [Chitinophagales bacterium]
LRPLVTDAIVPNLTYLWQDGSTNPELTVSEAGIYSVTVSNECFTKTDAVTITTENCGCVVSFPSAFSPNEDGINDTFRPASNCSVTNYKLSIYTRYGNEIFSSTDITEGWDGVVDFEAANMKVYVWVVTYETGISDLFKTVVESGSVFLLR